VNGTFAFARFAQPVRIYAAGYEDYKDADIAVITGWARQQPGHSG
jgi:malate/lactate dehydrogenase